MSAFQLPRLPNLSSAVPSPPTTREPVRDERLHMLGLGAGYFEGPATGGENRSQRTVEQPPAPAPNTFRGINITDLMEVEGEFGPDNYHADHVQQSGKIGGMNYSLGEVHAHNGIWRDDQGRSNVGHEIDLARARFSYGSGMNTVDVGVGTVNAGVKHNEDTTSIGAQANIIEGSVTTGTKEENARFGLGLGWGMGARVHHGDADNDGQREYGFGFDAGPVSVDVRSETAGRAGSSFGGRIKSLLGLDRVEFGPDIVSPNADK